jgi:hypothetical protein
MLVLCHIAKVLVIVCTVMVFEVRVAVHPYPPSRLFFLISVFCSSQFFCFQSALLQVLRVRLTIISIVRNFSNEASLQISSPIIVQASLLKNETRLLSGLCFFCCGDKLRILV